MNQLKKIKCPECGENVELEDWLEKGDCIACSGCDQELQILSLAPLKVSIVKINEEEKDYFINADDEDEV